MSEINAQVGQRIRQLRTERDWLQSDLASATHLPMRTIGRIERGEVDVRLSTLEKIAKAFNIPLRDLL